MADDGDDTDRLIQEVLAELGWDHDAATIARKVRQLNRGLPAEDEFIAICSWLGRAKLIHKLDQLQAPQTSREHYQVPDLLARFKGLGPVLIEVKNKKPPKLSFTADYLRRLQAYADLLGMPLLIAWKILGIWTLFEARHLKLARTNHNIVLDTAMKENLLGILAGDAAYVIEPGAGIQFHIRKEKLLGVEHDGPDRTEQWQMRIERVGFTGAGGKPATKLDGEVSTLFTTWDLESRETHSETHVDLSFVAGTDNGIMFGHMALVHLLRWPLRNSSPINWRHVIRRKRVVANMPGFRSALERGMQQNIVRTILDQRPQTWPAFVPASIVDDE